MSDHYYLDMADGGAEQSRRYRLAELPCTVGRSPECDLQLDHDRISREHARFESRDGKLQIVDLESTNGTFVNGQRISEATVVRPGDTLHLANHEFTLLQRTASGLTGAMPSLNESNSTNETVMGFTARPSGFPAQAPQFYELLNGEQIQGVCQPIVKANGVRFGYAVEGRGTHARLPQSARDLFSLADQLGEEARLGELFRKHGLAQASRAGLEGELFVAVHPVECEDLEVLFDQIDELSRRHHDLMLTCEFPFEAVNSDDRLATIRETFNSMDLRIGCRGIDHGDQQALAIIGKTFHYARLHCPTDAESLAAAAEALGPVVRILVDGIDDREGVEALRQAGGELFQGPAFGPMEDIPDF